MTIRKLILPVLLIPAIIAAALLGCSDKTFTSSTTSVAQNAGPTAYMPLEQGLRVSYVLTEPETKHIDIEIADPVVVAGNPGFEVRWIDRTANETSITYRYAKGNSVYESGSLSSPGYRILESPFVTGHNWNRHDTAAATGTGLTGGGEDEDQQADDETIGGGKGGITIFGDGFGKIIPGEDFNTMQIVGFEDVHGLNGVVYGNCLKVAWRTDPLRTSYFWYYAGVGMVKFEYGFNTVYSDVNHVIGVVTDYQTVEY